MKLAISLTDFSYKYWSTELINFIHLYTNNEACGSSATLHGLEIK